jgi:GTP cyclohydrolase II
MSSESYALDNVADPAVIDHFSGRWAFLSNYFLAVVHLDGLKYPSVEHAYQAAKTHNPDIRTLIAETPDPDEAKRLGRCHLDRKDWEETKVAVMRVLVEEKFRDRKLLELLLSTGTAELVEGNDWGDEFWGRCQDRGENYMGLILMAIRLRAQRDTRNSENGLGVRPATAKVGRAAHASIPTAHGVFTAWACRVGSAQSDHLALTIGQVRDQENVLVRVHSECLTGEAFGSLRCDCGAQLDAALELIAKAGTGAVLHLRGHEGRGIGLLAKVRAYALQDAGFDTVDANCAMGFPVDSREYLAAAQMLSYLGVRSVRLLSNNPAKSAALTALGIKVTEQIPLGVAANPYDLRYLITKRDRMGHNLPGLPVLPWRAQ